MSEYETRFYAVLTPNNSLVASQLTPQAFARHYTVGSVKHYSGKVIFVEVDPSLEDGYFKINQVLKDLKPHKDGSPKRTKFISNYRVLENIPMDKFKNMYLATVDGQCLELTRSDYTAKNDPGLVRIYQQINPLQMLVASNLDQRDYASYYTREDNIKGCPKLCFTQIDLVIDDFINMYQQDLASYNVLPNIPSGRLYDCIKELLDNRNKVGKTISLASIFPKLGYRWLKHGFWISEKDELIFYPFPSLEELEHDHHFWWRSAEMAY